MRAARRSVVLLLGTALPGDNDTTTEEPAVASRGVANGISPEIRGRGVASNATWRERIFEEDSEMED
jgi:hypothetical protein